MTNKLMILIFLLPTFAFAHNGAVSSGGENLRPYFKGANELKTILDSSEVKNTVGAFAMITEVRRLQMVENVVRYEIVTSEGCRTQIEVAYVDRRSDRVEVISVGECR